MAASAAMRSMLAWRLTPMNAASGMPGRSALHLKTGLPATFSCIVRMHRPDLAGKANFFALAHDFGRRVAADHGDAARAQQAVQRAIERNAGGFGIAVMRRGAAAIRGK